MDLKRRNFTEAKSRDVCTFLVDKGLFLKNQTTTVAKKTVWPSSTLETVNLDYCLSLSVAQLVQKFTAHERQSLQGNPFLLVVCMPEVPLFVLHFIRIFVFFFSISIISRSHFITSVLSFYFCSPSLVQLSTASYRVWSVELAPNCIQ